MSTPYELPVEPDLIAVPLDPDGSALPERPPLQLVPDEAPEPVDFDGFVRRQSPRLRRLIMRKLGGDIGEAEEIVQETLLRAHQHLHTLRTENELIAWTTVVGQRLAIDRIRIRGRSVPVSEVPEDSRVGRDTADIVVARAEARTALDALEAIPDRQAAILWAREVEGLQYDAIAERFDITEPAVRSLLHRGRKALRQEYAARGGTLPFRGLVPLAPGLIALRGLGRLRSAARQTVRGNIGAVATFSIAGALALGMTLGAGGSPVRAPLQGLLGPARVAQSQTGPAVLAMDHGAGAEDLRGGATRGGAAPLGHQSPLKSLGSACATATADTPVCVGSDRTSRGDVLWIGPTLPRNPIVDRIGVGQTYVAICDTLPTLPLTECSSDDDSAAAGRPAGGAPDLDIPSNVEGASP
ncbi:MAG TPA: RNA polymerase sigma factor [Mycobacteriales bacterium]|nr:RNA polymerase sigma factor [Mycobacteriales bacterium]